MGQSKQVWQGLLALQDRAARVAYARGARAEDIEDIVQEALVRIAAMETVDLTRVGALLTAVVSNLVADRHRSDQVASRHSLRLIPAPLAAPEDEIVDRAEAEWLWSRLDILGMQDRRVFELRMSGMSVGATAATLNLTYKATESTYARARGRMRQVWATG